MAKKKTKSYKTGGGFSNPTGRMMKFKNGGDKKTNGVFNALKTGLGNAAKGAASVLPSASPGLYAIDKIVNKPQSRVSETTPPVYNMNRTKEPMPGTRPQKNDRQLFREQFGTNNPTDQQLRDYFDSDEFKSKLPKTPVESDNTRRFVSPGLPSSDNVGTYKMPRKQEKPSKIPKKSIKVSSKKKGGKLKKAKKRKY